MTGGGITLNKLFRVGFTERVPQQYLREELSGQGDQLLQTSCGGSMPGMFQESRRAVWLEQSEYGE